MFSYNQFLKECAEFDKLAKECDNLVDKINAETEEYETAMHVMFFDDPPIEYLCEFVRRFRVLNGELKERVERLHTYNVMWEMRE